ncbi:protein toll-like [Haliotis cracherodii]|uniref:protein toll-like n=1 Tax=Haliotis cracherodii TaxID=6455 RepID=UPI0039ED41E7
MFSMYSVLLVAWLAMGVSGSACPSVSTTKKLNGKLGSPDFPSLDHLLNILSNETNSKSKGIDLNLSENSITELTSQTFADAIFQRVTSLDLSSNNLTEISKGLFNNFKCLRILNLGANNLQMVASDVFHGLGNVKVLILRENYLTELPSGILDTGSVVSHLSVFDASRNRIVTIGGEVFHQGLVSLKEVNLSYNLLKTFEPWPYIPAIPLSRQLRFNLQHNDISRLTNNLRWTKTREFSGTVDLRYNSFRYFRKEQFSQYLDGKEPTAFDIGTMYLNFHDNPWFCDCGLHYAVKIAKVTFFLEAALNYFQCDGPSEFKGKYLSYFFDNPDQLICNITERCPADCKCQDRPHDGYTLVDCASAGEYADLPQTVPPGPLFLQLPHNKITSLSHRDYLQNITQLDVSSNNILHLEDSFLEKVTSLEYLDIRNNSLKTLPSRIQNFRMSSVRFSGNPLVCSCDTIWLNDWVRRNSENMSSDFLSRHLCYHTGRYLRLVDVTWNSLVCYRDIAISVSVVLGVLLIILIVCTVVCCKRKYECKVLMYDYFRFHPFDHASCDKADDATKTHDVYISMDRENEDIRLWVKDKLLKRLEKKSKSRPAYKVYYPCRQDDFGDSIADQMVENINKSRRVLAIVNSSYLKNGWSIEEFDFAHRLMEETKSGRLLVLLHGEFDLSAVTQEPLKTYLSGRQCLNVSDRWLWRKLRYELPQRPRTNPISASRESLTSGISSIHASLSESSGVSVNQMDNPDFVTIGVV